jgi:proteasome alpha subunit
VEIVVAEVGEKPEGDQIYRITFDGSVTDEPGFVAFGGQADQVSAALKERYSPGMSLSGAFAAALAALSAPGNGGGNDVPGPQLEVAILDRTRDHRTFRRIRAARLEELISQSREVDSETSQAPQAPASPGAPAGPGPTASAEPPTGPDATGTDRGGGLSGGDTPPRPL